MRNFSDIREWHNNQILERLSEKLKKRDFNSLILNTKDEIIEYIKKTIPQDASVGIGGSVTIRELGIDELLSERGNKVFDHWDKSLDFEKIMETRKNQLRSDFS